MVLLAKPLAVVRVVMNAGTAPEILYFATPEFVATKRRLLAALIPLAGAKVNCVKLAP